MGSGGGGCGTWRGGSNALVATLSHTQLVEPEKQMNFSRSYDFATGRDCLSDLELFSVFVG